MSNDEQQNGGRRDAFGQRTSKQTFQQAPRRPAPGKVTLTSKLSQDRQPAVQRKTAAASHEASPGNHSDWLSPEVQARLDQCFGVGAGSITEAPRPGVAPTQSVQRSAPTRARKTSRQLTTDRWMDAAHRGASAFPDDSHAAVQSRGDVGTDDPASVHQAAAAGVSGAGNALPYFDRIQAAFGGAHDLSHARAHVGGEAAAASERIGAQAYTTGDHVAFRSQPDLHTAAHEAAHVVQQRAGVQLAGGVGQAGDAYERQADAVADVVVRGESAAALLGAGTGAPWHGDVAADARATQALQMDGAEDADEHAGGGRGLDDVADASPAGRARAIHDAFHGSLFSEDEERALQQLRGQSLAAIRRIRSAYRAQYGAKLEDEFSSYCDGAQAAEALALIWPAMPVIDRLAGNTELMGDNEDAMMDVLRTASRSELAAAAADPRLQGLLDELSVAQQYEARRLIWPERKYEHVLWRIEQAHGTFSDDEDAVYTALLALSAAERRALWDEREQRLSFLGESELALIRRMCVGENGGAATDATALDVRMEIATEGLGTDDDAVGLVVGRTASLAEEETRLRATLDAGVTPEGEALSAQQRAAIDVRLSEIGGVQENLLTSRRDANGALADDRFLGRLHDDVGTEEYGAFAGAMGGDADERAKQQLLDAVGVLNDDEDAIYRAFRELRAPLELPPGRTTADYSPDELRQMQEQATNALRDRLRSDPDMASVWSALDEDELAALDVHAAGDSYQVAIHELEDAYHGFDTDEARIVRIVAGMSAADRARMTEERPPIYGVLMTGLDAAEFELVRDVFRTGRVPTNRALDVAMGGFGDGTDEEMLLDSLGTMPDEERRAYRLGYWLHKQGRSATDVQGEAQQQALQRFRDLYARMEAELDDEELDAAMERLIGLPAPEDFLSPEGRRMAAEIMAHRHRERMALSGGITEPFTSTDETAEQSAMIYEAHLQQLLARGGDISLEDFSVLVGLDAQFSGRFDEYRATVEMVSNIAGTVAATVAAIVIVVLSKGTLAPAAAKLISSSGGAALWAAVAGAGTRVAASEAFGGDFHQTLSTEGAQNALVGAIEGAVAVASAALAARALKFVGLSQRALSAEITRAALDSTETGLALSGRGLAHGSLEGAIDGFVSGAVGDLVMTATDAQTWRRSVWNTLGSLGMSLLRGGAFGAGSGAAVGGAMHGASAFLRGRGLSEKSESAGRLDGPRVPEKPDSTGEPHADAERLRDPVSSQHEPDVSKADPGSKTDASGGPRASTRRTAEEHTALAAELPPELRGVVDILESDAIQGAGVHVAYKDGALRIEVGPDAKPRHVRYHVGTARHLLKYQGPLGQIRKLLDAILTKLRLTPGYGTRGFEARQEVEKLLEIQAELETLRVRLDGRVRALDGHGALSQLDARQIDRELAEIQEQLEYHQGFIDSYKPGRGFVAAASHGRQLPELPVARSALYEKESVTSKEWSLYYYARPSDGTDDIFWGWTTVYLDDAGLPESYPSFVIEARVHRDGVEQAMHIYDEVTAGGIEHAGQSAGRIGTGTRTPATYYAIERMLEAYKKRFGHLPDAIKGSLGDKNKLNFQREYVRARIEQGLPEEEAKLAAIRRISFGRHRIAFGYDDFDVKLGNEVELDIGPPYGLQKVPETVDVIARQFDRPK
jgi:hypothetical protein